MERTHALLALENGSLFRGVSIGVAGQTVGELVFNTGMTGYQEILTDASYRRQIVTLTYPHIGNTGTNNEDAQAPQVHAAGLVVRDLPLRHSSWRAQESLGHYLQRHKVIAMANVDTRRLTRLLRDQGAQNSCLMAGEIDEKAALAAARDFPGIKGMDIAQDVSTDTAYEWSQGSWTLEAGMPQNPPAARFHVVAYDYGVKHNSLRMMADRSCRITVVPARTPVEEVLAMQPDGVYLSNGPGDPEPCDYAIAAIRKLMDENVPMFGICLGHQLLGLACGARTVKMKFGHHGINHPVQDLRTGRVLISSQNHGFAVDEDTLPDKLKATHRSLFDGSLQGVEHQSKPAFGFQGHPEAGPGPLDLAPLFDHFIELMESR